MPKYAIKKSRYLAGHFVNPRGESPFFAIVDGSEDLHYVLATPEFPAIVEVPLGHKVDEGLIPTDEATKAEKLKWRAKHDAERQANQGNTKVSAQSIAPAVEVFSSEQPKPHFAPKKGGPLSSLQVHGKVDEAKGKGKRASDDEPI